MTELLKQATLDFMNYIILSVVVFSILIILYALISSLRKRGATTGELLSQQNKKKVRLAKKRAMKNSEIFSRPSYSISSMLGIQEFTDDKDLFIFYERYCGGVSEKQQESILNDLIVSLKKNEIRNKEIFTKSITALIGSLKESKDEEVLVETSALQMYLFQLTLQKELK